MGGDILLLVSPFIFVLMSAYILFELVRINNVLHLSQLDSLMIIPIVTILSYLYIGIFNPPIEIARLLSRILMSIALGIDAHVLYSYSRLIRKGGKH